MRVRKRKMALKNTVGVRIFQSPSPPSKCSLVLWKTKAAIFALYSFPYSVINISERARYCARKRNYTILARGDKKKKEREREKMLRRWWKESEKPVGSRTCAIYLTIASACLYFLREKDKWTETKYIITIGYEYYEINNYIKHCIIIDVRNARKKYNIEQSIKQFGTIYQKVATLNC